MLRGPDPELDRRAGHVVLHILRPEHDSKEGSS
jgi:hypothetical protein